MDEALVIVFLIIVGFGAAFVQRVTGFGLGIFAMLFLPSFMPNVTASATVSAVFSFGITTYNSIKYRKSIALKTAVPMLVSAMITIPVAVYFASKITHDTFETLLGVLLILLSFFFIFFSNRIKIKANVKNGIISGGISGVLSGLFSTGGPPAAVYLSSAINEKTAYFATIQFVFCIINIYTTVTRAINGLLTLRLIAYAAVGFVGCLLGNFVGKLIFNKLDGNKLKKVIYIGMILSGIIMIF